MLQRVTRFMRGHTHRRQRVQGRAVRDLVARILDADYRGWRVRHTRDVTRLAAYARHMPLAAFLSPVDLHRVEIDEWPHYYFCRPGLEPVAC